MKCRSVAGIWPETPPSHHVTSTVAIDRPPTIFTGADDGSVVRWSIAGDESKKDVRPVAVLCGHASPITSLGICYPLPASVDVSGVDSPCNNEAANLASTEGSALISCCSEGVLCVWSLTSGHCRRRRKLPPWVGSPCALQPLPSNPRFVCIYCCFFEAFHKISHKYEDDPEETVQGHGIKDSDNKWQTKCSVVVVDSYTLTITHTIFHGNLSIGPSNFMGVVRVQLLDETEKQSILLVDALGKIQLIPVLKDSNLDSGLKIKLHDISFYAHKRVWDDAFLEDEHVLSISTTGNVVGLVYKTQCVFMLVSSNNEIGMISFDNDLLHPESQAMDQHAIGGLFVHSKDRNISNIEENHSDLDSVKFVVWNIRGFAIVYSLSYNDQTFKSDILGAIPTACYNNEVQLYIDFVQLDHYLLRIESVSFEKEEPYSWKPHITVWSLSRILDDHEIPAHKCKFIGEGDYLSPWILISRRTESSGAALDSSPAVTKITSAVNTGLIESEVEANFSRDGLKHASSQQRSLVTSSMVVSHNSHIPCAIVYGYSNGDLELVQFEGFLHESVMDYGHIKSHEVKQKFCGHRGAVLCLASHHMTVMSAEQNFSEVLISGSMDCTVRLWDLKTGNPIMVMHHHVSPIRRIVLAPFQIDRPWNDCFLSVGEDCCVALASLSTLRVERMFPGHPNYPSKVVWDGLRGYLACLCQNQSSASGAKDVLFIWDIKTGSRERVLHGTASQSMFENFCKGVRISDHNTSGSSLLVPLMESQGSPRSHLIDNVIDSTPGANSIHGAMNQQNTKNTDSVTPNPGMVHNDKQPIVCSCPLPGISVLSFDLASLMSCGIMGGWGAKQRRFPLNNVGNEKCSSLQIERDVSEFYQTGPILPDATESHSPDNAIVMYLLRLSMAFLHLWDVQSELDSLLINEMRLRKPGAFVLAPGLQGDRGSVTLAFPGFSSTLELWKSSSEFSAIRSLTMVSLAQCMVGLSNSCSLASSALSAFYTRHFAEQFPFIKPPSLQLLVSFWHNEDEHVRMAARTIFHCAAARAIPPPLCRPKAVCQAKNLNFEDELGQSEVKQVNLDDADGSSLDVEELSDNQGNSEDNDDEILKWMESYEMQDWVSCVGGTSQDAMASHIIVAAALAIWYRSLVKCSLAFLAVHPLMKLVMAMNEKYSSTAAELLAEGMDSTWKACIRSDIPRFIGDLFFQIECVSGASGNPASALRPLVPPKIRETLVGILLPSLALTDIPEFLSVTEGLIWSTASDSPVHLVSIKTLIRIVRGSPRSLAQYLKKVIHFILQTIDPSNSVMRRTCLKSSMTALKEVARVYPMIALNEASTRLAVGDAIAEINTATIHVYDMQSVAKIKVLDASGPPGLPTFLKGDSETITSAVSALKFSRDGEGLVAFSEHGLIIRWWSLGSGWWEKLSRNFVPVQCTKLIFVPPWEGLSPNSSRKSIMANISGNDSKPISQDHKRGSGDADTLSHLVHNLDLSYRLEWAGERNVQLTRQGNMLGSFQL